jgi:hypothetical protein
MSNPRTVNDYIDLFTGIRDKMSGGHYVVEFMDDYDDGEYSLNDILVKSEVSLIGPTRSINDYENKVIVQLS